MWKRGERYNGELHALDFKYLSSSRYQRGVPVERGFPVDNTPFTSVCGYDDPDFYVVCQGGTDEIVPCDNTAGHCEGFSQWIKVPVEE